MDHSENDKRFCVYVLRGPHGEIRYVGSGTRHRPKFKARGVNKELLDVIYSLTPEVVKEGLTKSESIIEECRLYEELLSTGLLLNKTRPSNIKPIFFKEVDDLLYYDETSPTFLRWKVARYGGRHKNVPTVFAGDIAGSNSSGGYYKVKINGKCYPAHRLVWVLCNKTDIESNLVVDHIDRNRKNNNWLNLRLVTPKENSENTVIPRETNTNYTGVHYKEGYDLIVVKWTEDFTSKTRNFNFRKIFPNIDRDIAKQKCIEIAAWYREQILNTTE